MSATKVERLGYVAGALFPIAIWGSIILEGQGRTYPNYEEGAIGTSALRDFFDVGAANRIGMMLGILAPLLLLWFATAIYARATRRGERARPAALLCLISAAVAAALIISTSGSALVIHNDAGLVDPGVLLVWLAGSELVFGSFVAAFLGIAGLMGTIAYLGFTQRVVPRWVAWPAAVLTATMAFGTIAAPFGDVSFVAWLSFMVFTLWILIAGIRLAVRPSDAPPALEPTDTVFPVAA